MKNNLYYLSLYIFIFCFSCQKDATIKNSAFLSSVNVDNYLPQGDGESGVDATTGYTNITKHYVSVWNANLNRYDIVWDGRWESNWYGYHVWVQIQTYQIGAKLGDPVSAILSPDNTQVSVASNGGYLSSGYVSFTMTIPLLVVASNYSSTALSTYDQQLRDYMNGTSSTYPTPPGSSLAGAAVKIVFGKVIKTNTADGFGLAQIDWMPPPALPLPYGVNQTSQVLNTTSAISGTTQTITVVDNKTLSVFTPTITFKINTTNQMLVQSGSLYSVSSAYTSTYAGVTWTQALELFPRQQIYTTPIPNPAPNPTLSTNETSFGLEGHFTGTSVSASTLAIVIIYNYVTKTVKISYNNSVYLSYWQTNAQ